MNNLYDTKCKICKNILIKTKIDYLYICKNCFHIQNSKNTNISKGYCLHNKYSIWIDIIHLLDDPHLLFTWINSLSNIINIYIKVPCLNDKLNKNKNYDCIHYFNINSMKLLCEINKFNIIDLYQINIFDEIFYIFQIKEKDKEYDHNPFDIYEHIYNEIINDIYDLTIYT